MNGMDWLVFLAVMAAWLFLQGILLPKMGVPT
jgi:hypothetical protein